MKKLHHAAAVAMAISRAVVETGNAAAVSAALKSYYVALPADCSHYSEVAAIYEEALSAVAMAHKHVTEKAAASADIPPSHELGESGA